MPIDYKPISILCENVNYFVLKIKVITSEELKLLAGCAKFN